MTGKDDDARRQVVRTWIWSGFYDPEGIDELIHDIVADGGDDGAARGRLSAIAGSEFAAKADAERSWPAETDCDRLDDAFLALESLGIIALQNAGLTQSDALADVNGEFEDRDRPDNFFGYCFYHGQDVERAVAGDGLWIAFGVFREDARTDAAAVGRLVKDTLERHGLAVDGSGAANGRLQVKIDWKRRGPGPD